MGWYKRSSVSQVKMEAVQVEAMEVKKKSDFQTYECFVKGCDHGPLLPKLESSYNKYSM